jgi:nucleotide-binding universal stress UspA family protein
MNTLRRGGIVVGVDESAPAGQAVRWAAEQASLEGRSVRLVRAVLPVPPGRSDHAAVVQPGPVLGSRGRGPLLSHLPGSVGVHVVRHATCPGVVHRPGHPGQVRHGVVVAVDATEEEALEHATSPVVVVPVAGRS